MSFSNGRSRGEIPPGTSFHGPVFTADEVPGPEEIGLQLQEILNSPAFHGSKRCQQFLEYVCCKSLAGESGALKEKVIAVDVFGRAPHSDLSDDTIVRVGAREVRKRLAQFYVSPAGMASEIRIDLPAGSYAPEFRYAHDHKGRAAPPPAEIPSAKRHRWRPIVAASAALAATVAFAVAKWEKAPGDQAAFVQFWEPVFQSHEPMLLAVAHPIVYHPSLRALRLSEESLPPQVTPFQRPLHVPPEKLNGSDLIPVFNQYVGYGDLVAATEVSVMLARRSKDVRVRLASSLPFADLRQMQTLLIGSITNRWTMELQSAWRFQFRRDRDLHAVIVDTMAPPGPQAREWSIPARDDGLTQEDYILVSRICNSVTGGFLMVAAGLKQFGTEAAGRLLTDPERFAAILKRLPPGWETKNVQIVLRARVIGNAPAQPEVVAWHVWAGTSAAGSAHGTNPSSPAP